MKTDRNAEIAKIARETSLTYKEIGNIYGITKQRVYQICLVNERRQGGLIRGIMKKNNIDIDLARRGRRQYLLKRIEQLDYEYPIMQDWYVNNLSVRQICEKWVIQHKDFRNINNKWIKYFNYYKDKDEQANL